MNSDVVREYSSFRDPSGHVFEKDGVLYREVSADYMPQYRRLMDSGLYAELQKHQALVAHEETGLDGLTENAALVIRPERIPLISYPYEWTFGQLKDAALLTLKLHRRAMRHEMILKDASAYNIQFLRGRPLLIDTLSFDFYQDATPWGAYGQFCRHFLAPLLLMAEVDLNLNKMLRLYIDGIPLDLAAALLKGRGGFFARQHIVWHAGSIAKHAEDGKAGKEWIQQAARPLSKKAHLSMIEGLIAGIERLRLPNVQTEWDNYYANSNYTKEAESSKRALVRQFLAQVMPKTVWDLGANDGTYSKLALEFGAHVAAMDIDPLAVERNYSYVKREGLTMLPLVQDLTNPSPGIGFFNKERTPLHERQKPDCIMALALIHHLAISNNLPLDMLAAWFAQIGRSLIIEFVPKEDSQVQILLATRPDIFPGYTKEGFETAFSRYFICRKAMPVEDSCRTLYLWEVRE